MTTLRPNPVTKELAMTSPVQIEDIEAMRGVEGIVDAELREAIRNLRVGRHVRLTFLASGKPSAGETLSVRITHIYRSGFCGKLTQRPVSAALAGIAVGAPVEFTSAQIHSLPPERTRN
jgi:hypothetical protein